MDESKKSTNRIQIPKAYNISVIEIKTLYDLCKNGDDGIWEAITKAYQHGFVMGIKSQKKNRQRKEC